jgi:hypothetical protein
MVDPTRDAPQRGSLRFCKAFFEVADPGGVRLGLAELGAQELPGDETGHWYVWHLAEERLAAPFLIRIRERRLVLEGPDPGAVGIAWRRLDEALGSAATARVAAGDDLQRFLPKARVRTADRPETFGPEHEAKVLAEFHAAVYARWADTTQARLGGLTPREAAGDPDAQALLATLLSTMRIVEKERRDRGMPAISVDELETTLFG